MKTDVELRECTTWTRRKRHLYVAGDSHTLCQNLIYSQRDYHPRIVLESLFECRSCALARRKLGL